MKEKENEKEEKEEGKEGTELEEDSGRHMDVTSISVKRMMKGLVSNHDIYSLRRSSCTRLYY